LRDQTEDGKYFNILRVNFDFDQDMCVEFGACYVLNEHVQLVSFDVKGPHI